MNPPRVPQFQRSQVDTLVERLSEQPERIIAMFGPRQTGKTTAVHQALRIVHDTRGMEFEHVRVDEPDSQDASSLPTAVDPGMSALHGSSPPGSAARLPGLPASGSAAMPFPTAARDGRWLAGVWERCRQRAQRSVSGFVLVLDEVQKVERWSEAVKGLWDADRARGCPMHVVILGSAPLLMQAGLTESLAGRFEPIRITHWSYSEMSRAFDFGLEQYVYFGGYPGAASRAAEASTTGDSERWAVYVREALVEPNVERDVLAMTRITKPALLRRLLELGASHSGRVLAYNKMLGQLQDAGNATTLAEYLELLSQAGLLAGLSKHTKRLASPKASTPKLNVLNTAVMSALSGYTFEEARADPEFWGHMVESAVGAHLRNTASSRTDVEYWREEGHGRSVEVDFVLRRGPNTAGIEVKTGRLRPSEAISGLEEFRRRFGAAATIVVAEKVEPLGQTVYLLDQTGEPLGQTKLVPLGDFLSQPADHWLTTADAP